MDSYKLAEAIIGHMVALACPAAAPSSPGDGFRPHSKPLQFEHHEIVWCPLNAGT